MNFIKKYWIILASFTITAIIAIILYRWFNKSFVSIIVAIPSLFLSLFINSSREQEKLAKMQIAEKKKEQEEKEKQERFEKMLEFTYITLIKNKNEKQLTQIERQIVDIKISGVCTAKYLIFDYRHGIYCAPSSTEQAANLFNKKLYCRDADGKKIIDILKQELPKILTPDVFNGETLIVKDEQF